MSFSRGLLRASILCLCGWVGGSEAQGQKFSDFTSPKPLGEDQVLVLGFLGGREPWDNRRDAVRQLALKMRDSGLPVAVETVENRRRRLALRLIVAAFDKDGDRTLDLEEKERVKLVLFGQSFGGAAVVKVARMLQTEGIPVLLTVQIDSVGRRDSIIPDNVSSAANLFQSNGILIRGEPEIVAEDPGKTVILGNFRYDYKGKKVDTSGVPFWKRIFRKAHVKMAKDPEVWARVESLIVQAVKGLKPSGI